MTDDLTGAQTEFRHRLLSEWLPTYCDDPNRNYPKEGFKSDSIKVTSRDVHDFMRAIDNDIVTDIGGGRYRMPQSKAIEVIFWEGSVAKTPRPITLWLEPIITIAAIARLHLDYGWPKDCLGTQSEKWEFDVIAFKPQNLQNEYIAGEVKKSSKELDELLINLRKSCAEGDLDLSTATPVRINAHKKWLGLRRCQAPFFWAIGPGGDSRLFEVFYSSAGDITLNATTDDRLNFSANA